MTCDRSEYSTTLEASDFQRNKEASEKSPVKAGACSENETSSMSGKPENQILSPNGFSGTRPPPYLNGQQSTRIGVDTEMMDVPDDERKTGSSPSQKRCQNSILQPVSYGVSTGNPTKTSYDKVPSPPIDSRVKKDVPMNLGNYGSPSRLASDALNQSADPVSNSSLVDVLTSTICNRITILLSNYASPEELRNAIRSELSARLPPANQGMFNAKSPNESGSVGGQTKPVVCSICKLVLKRPCDLK